MNNNIIHFREIKFYNYSYSYIIKKITREGGYLVAPAASSLSTILKNKLYYHSLKNSSIAILDSGFFCVLLRVFRLKKIKKLSGYLFLRKIISTNRIKHQKILLINPSLNEDRINTKFFRKNNFKKICNYIAPQYRKNKIILDVKLINLINKAKPKFILINIGGEKQEILAEYIYRKCNNKKIVLFCLGAAIAFLTKSQAPISPLIDRWYLGWLLRLIYNPMAYSSRVLKSILLIKLFF